MDLFRENYLDEFLHDEEREQLISELKERWEIETKNNVCFMSVVNKEGLDELKVKLKNIINELYIERYPYKTRFW